MRANPFGWVRGARGGLALGLAVCCTAARALPAPPEGTLRDGERLTYSVRWGFVPSVGRIIISADTIGTGPEAALRVTTETYTWGVARGIFPFNGRGESVYRADTGLLLSTSEWSAYRHREIKNTVTFDYDRARARFTDELHPEKSKTLAMPPGSPSDLILALIQTRAWNLQPGEKRDALVIFEDQFYPLTIRAEDYDYVLTSMGLFKALVLVPSMEKTPPIGMFKRGSTVRVWIETDDSRHLPVRFEVGFRIGTGTATILDYQPPK